MQANYLSAYRVPPLALLVLLLSLVQGTSTTLALSFHFLRPAEFLVNVTWMATYLLAAVGLFISFGVNWITWLIRYRLLLIILLIGVIASTFWSVDTTLTAERSVHMVGSTLIAFFIGFTVPLTRIVSISAIVFAILMLASAAMAIGLPAYGTEPYSGINAWRGVMAAKNTLGFWASVSCMLSVTMMMRTQTVPGKALWLVALAFRAGARGSHGRGLRPLHSASLSVRPDINARTRGLSDWGDCCVVSTNRYRGADWSLR